MYKITLTMKDNGLPVSIYFSGNITVHKVETEVWGRDRGLDRRQQSESHVHVQGCRWAVRESFEEVEKRIEKALSKPLATTSKTGAGV